MRDDEAEAFVQFSRGIDFRGVQAQDDAALQCVRNQIANQRGTDAVTLVRRQNVDTVEVERFEGAFDGHPAYVNSIHTDDLGGCGVMVLGKLRALDFLAAPAEERFDKPALRLEIRPFHKGTVVRGGSPKLDDHAPGFSAGPPPPVTGS